MDFSGFAINRLEDWMKLDKLSTLKISQRLDVFWRVAVDDDIGEECLLTCTCFLLLIRY